MVLRMSCGKGRYRVAALKNTGNVDENTSNAYPRGRSVNTELSPFVRTFACLGECVGAGHLNLDDGTKVGPGNGEEKRQPR